MYSSENLKLFRKVKTMKECFMLSSEEFSYQRVQSQTCLSYASAAENHLCVKCM